MKYRETMKRGLSLLLALVLTVSLIIPAAAADGGSGAELVAAFDKTSCSAGETVTVTFTVYGADFDAAGFHVTYDQSSLTYQSVQAGSGFAMPVRKVQEGALELMVESGAVQQPGSNGTVIAAVTFTAVTAGEKTLQFTTGSAAYLERKSAVVYNGYQALNVTASVAADAAADAALRQAKADAVAQLEADINGKLEAGVTVAQRELLLRCLQSGRAAIHNAKSLDAVSDALNSALERAAEIAAETTLEFPKLTVLYDAENNDSTAIGNMYPAFSPDTTAYFIYNSRPINGTPRSFKGATTSGVTVTFNGEAVSVEADGTFAFAVPFQALENCNTLVLTDESTGLSTVYAFYSFGNSVKGGFSDVKVYNEEGEAPGDEIQQVSLGNPSSVTRVSSSIDKVRVGFTSSGAANEEHLIDLVDGNGRVLQSFTAVSGDKAASQTFLSDVIQLKKGTNSLLLRYHGVDKSKWEDGKPVPIPAYKTVALVINYVDPNDNDPALKDTAPEKVELYIKGIASDAVPTEPQEIEFQWKEKTETTPAQWESTVELTPDDFDLGEDLEYLSQVIHLRVALKDGQEITVTGGNEMPQRRTLLSDGSYHVADYYESFGNAGRPTVMKKDSFTVTITVTAKNGIDKAIYLITVNKSGKAAMIIPMVYRSRELTITDKRPIRTQQLTFNAVSITDNEGLPIDTAGAFDAGTLTVEFADPTVASWDGKTRNGDNLTVSLLKQGKTEVKLIYDDGELHLEGTSVLYVNYTIGMLNVARTDAADLWTEAKNGKREYEEGAMDDLKAAIQAANQVYDVYKDKDRRLMDQTQFDEINDAVNALREAIDIFKHREIGIKIVEFPGWTEAYDLPESVPYNAQPSSFTPKTLIGKDADGNEHEIKVTWSCKPTWDITEWDEKYYTFTAALEPGYVPAEGLEFPTFVVLKGLRPLSEPLTYDNLRFPANRDEDRGKKAINAVETPLYFYVYAGTALEELKALELETPTQGSGTHPLPTKCVEWPENYDPEDVENQKSEYIFKYTVDTDRQDGTFKWVWKDFTEDQRIFQISVKIIPRPTVTVKLDATDVSTIKVGVESVDWECGEEMDPESLGEIEIKRGDNGEWETVSLPATTKRFYMPLKYNFTPKTEVPGYNCEPKSVGDEHTICYTPKDIPDITLSKETLVLTAGEKGVSLKINETLPDGAKIKWTSDDPIVSANPNDEPKTIVKAENSETVESAEIKVTVSLGQQEPKSASCTVIVLPENLTITPDAWSMQVGDTKQLTVEGADLLEGLKKNEWSSDSDIADVDSTGLVTAKETGKEPITITATVETDNGFAFGTCTITVTPADPGGGGNGGDGNNSGGTGDGSGNGGGGTLSGQTTSGGDYRDLLTDPLPPQGTTGTTTPNTNTAQGTRRPQTGTSPAANQKPETAADTAAPAGNGGSGDGAGSGTTGRVISVAKGDNDKAAPGSAKELAVILISCSVLLAAGIFRGKKRGED